MKRALSLVVAILVSACATVGGPAVPPAARAELAPTGTLRVGLIAVQNLQFPGTLAELCEHVSGDPPIRWFSVQRIWRIRIRTFVYADAQTIH